MKQSNSMSTCAAWIAVLGMCMPCYAAEPAAPVQPASPVFDVALADGGTLVGRLLNAQGQPEVGIEVSASEQNGPVRTAVTDAHGWFMIRNVRGGIYQVEADQAVCVCRAWSYQTAPPSAGPGVLMINDPNVVAGQWQPGTVGTFMGDAKATLTHPLVVGAIIATAVAVPVAIHNSKDDNKNNTGS